LPPKNGGLYETGRIAAVPPGDILPNPNQPRRVFEPLALEELARSIERYGIIQPLTVRRAGRMFELVSGERRLRAAMMAGLQRVPCIVIDTLETDSAVLALVENLHRRDLDFIEEAEGIMRLITVHDLSQEEAARRLGKSQSAVANKLRILKLPTDLLERLRSAGLTERHARALLRLEGNEARRAALEEIIAQGLSVAKAEALIEKLAAAQPQKPARRSARPLYIVKDVRLFLNSLTRGLETMQRSGVAAHCQRSETEKELVLTIRIPKSDK